MVKEDFSKLDQRTKNMLLGARGEMWAKEELEKKYPRDKYLVLYMHASCEMDFFVINLENEEVICIYEVKTTTTDDKKFSAGSDIQTAVCQIQKNKKKGSKKYIPYFLYVIRVNKDSWNTGEFKVINEEIYNIDEFEPIRNENFIGWKIIKD
ncbi:MAG: hypothetical protein WC936_05895 [Candidatus Nanoarchaeia archaeon]|jgi:hypothetical protein